MGSFREKHKQELQTIQADLHKQLFSNILPFWEERVMDEEYGGYFTSFDRKGNRTSDLKPGWFVGRTLHTFSSLIHTYGAKDSWKQIAQHGRNYYDSPFYAGNGRFHYLQNRQGHVIQSLTSIFTDHFALGGLYEYILAFNKQEDVKLAKELSDALFKNVKDPEVHRQIGIREGMQKNALNFITMHIAQESTRLFGDAYKDIAEECAHKVLYVFPNDAYQAPFENVSRTGEPVFEHEGRLIDPGHAFESLWFVMEQGEMFGKPDYKKRAATILDWTIERCYDEQYGGFYQYVDVENHIPEEPFLSNTYIDIPVAWDAKIWWVQAEAMIAFAMSALLNENERHYQYFVKLHNYIKNYFLDPQYPEWYAFLNRDGSILSDAKGTQLKGPYHVPRALLKVERLINNYLQ